MEKVKIIYIICFILQVPSIPIISYLIYPISETLVYQNLYCDIFSHSVDESFVKEFKKLFPKEYGCRDTTFEGLALYSFFIIICIILLDSNCIFSYFPI